MAGFAVAVGSLPLSDLSPQKSKVLLHSTYLGISIGI